MKLGRVTKIDDDVMSGHCDVIVICPIYGQFEAIQRLESRCILCSTYIFNESNPLPYKNWKQI